MSARNSIVVAAAALRWNTAYENRRAAAKAKRAADQDYRDEVLHFLSDASSIAYRASEHLTEMRRRERAAVRSLALACAAFTDADDSGPRAKNLMLTSDVEARVVRDKGGDSV